MTREEILAMEPGRELDALVAEKVMGQSMWFSQNGSSIPIPSFSADISAAWEVVEKTKVAIIPQSGAPKEMSYCVIYEAGPFNKEIKIFAETAPEAICKVALLAVMENAE